MPGPWTQARAGWIRIPVASIPLSEPGSRQSLAGFAWPSMPSAGPVVSVIAQRAEHRQPFRWKPAPRAGKRRRRNKRRRYSRTGKEDNPTITWPADQSRPKCRYSNANGNRASNTPSPYSSPKLDSRTERELVAGEVPARVARVHERPRGRYVRQVPLALPPGQSGVDLH